MLMPLALQCQYRGLGAGLRKKKKKTRGAKGHSPP